MPKWGVSTEVREPSIRGGRKSVRAIRMENIKKQGPLNLQLQISYKLTETETACIRPVPVCTKSSTLISWLLA